MTTNRAVPTRSSALLLVAIPMVLSIVSIASARELDFEQRVAAQRAIEQVYWSHQIWPKENPSQKPALSAVMSDEAIRAKVGDYLKKSNALATIWKRPVTAEQLQAELDRMAKSTRDAETLARQTLVERLIRNWYATDDRFHGAVKRDAERALEGTRTVAEMKALGGEYVERMLVSRGDDVGTPGEKYEDVVKMDGAEWTDWKDDLARRFGTAPEALRLQRLSALQEDPDRFFVTAVLSFEADEAVVASVVWPKRSFDAWWSAERVGMPAEVVAEVGVYAIAAPIGRGCVDDTWAGRFHLPSAQDSHTAVWTGTEMLVWGGVAVAPS